MGETFDGSPTFTIVLVLANVFTLLTVLPFCMMDDYFGVANLDARKIFHSALAFGFTFSIMLSRALFLALSTGDVFIIHINGYLHSLMAFFMFGVQVAISVMYFVLNARNSVVIARSPIFIALLGTLAFLLLILNYNNNIILESLNKSYIYNNLSYKAYLTAFVYLETDSMWFYLS